MPDFHEELPKFLKPRLRLFFGVDLVGSTSYKQKGEFPLKNPEDDDFCNLGATWFSEIANFYRSVDQRFSIAWSDCCTAYEQATESELSAKPELWKSNGDELIYSVVLNEPDDVAYVLAAWLKALKEYRADLKSHNQNLDIKGSAWTAGFPIGNAEVIFCSDVANKIERYEDEDPKVFHFRLLEQWYKSKDTRSGLVKDYVGPAIDTGFRIASKASPRKFSVSFEVGFILSHVELLQGFCEQYGFTNSSLEMGFDGLEELKGVLDGKPYPIFWIDFLHNELSVEPIYELAMPHKPDRDKIKTFCQKFISDNDTNFVTPFIAGSSYPHFKMPPKNYRETLEKLAKRWEEEKKRLDIRWESQLDDDVPSGGGDTASSEELVVINLPPAMKPNTEK